MLVPVFNKESAAEELFRLCSTLNQAHEHCKDNNFTWRIAQLASQAEDLYIEFLSTFKLPDIGLNAEHNFPFENIAVNYPNATEVFLSFAFSTIAGMDAAHYENITLSEDFKIKLHELSRAVLGLLHEYRDEVAQE